MKLSMLDCIKIKWNNLHQTNFCSTTIKTTIFFTTCYGLFITFIQCKYISFTKLFWINLNLIFTHNYCKRCPLEPLWWSFDKKWTTASIKTSGNECGVKEIFSSSMLATSIFKCFGCKLSKDIIWSKKKIVSFSRYTFINSTAFFLQLWRNV